MTWRTDPPPHQIWIIGKFFANDYSREVIAAPCFADYMGRWVSVGADLKGEIELMSRGTIGPREWQMLPPVK